MEPRLNRVRVLDACRRLLDRMLSRVRFEVRLDGLGLSRREIDEQLQWGR